jgi:hypothetical protein
MSTTLAPGRRTAASWGPLLFVVLAAPAEGQVRIEVQRVPRAPEVKGAELIANAGTTACQLPVAMQFDFSKARFLSHREVACMVCFIPASDAVRLIEQVERSDGSPPQPGTPVGLLVFLNLMPKETKSVDEFYTFLWRIDTVRKLAFAVVEVKKVGPRGMRFCLRGRSNQLLVELPLRELAGETGDVVELDVVENQLECRLLGRYACRLDLSFGQYPY